jgi:hypothetical protein
MKKVLGTMSKFVGAIFSLAVLALLMSLTYGALQRIFPGNFTNQMWGLVMFDIAAMCWALIFVFQSHSTAQYAAAGTGFLVGFIGTLGMVAAEVILSGQDLAKIDTGEIGKWMIYGFIVVTALHAALVYIHHGTAPEIAEQINVGVARGEVVSQAIKDATHTIEAEKQELSRAIYYDIVSQVKRDLGLHPVTGTPFERKYEQAIPSPVPQELAHPEHIIWNRGNSPADYYDPSSEFALPCGHAAGATWNKEKQIHECNACGAAWDHNAPHTVDWHVEQIEKEEAKRQEDAPKPKPADNVFPMPPQEDQGDQPGPFPGPTDDAA